MLTDGPAKGALISDVDFSVGDLSLMTSKKTGIQIFFVVLKVQLLSEFIS